MTKNLGVRRGAVRINPTTPRPFAEFILRVTEGLRVTLSGTFDTTPLFRGEGANCLPAGWNLFELGGYFR